MARSATTLVALLLASAAALAQEGGDDEWDDWGDEWADDPTPAWTGFVELGMGSRVEDNPAIDRNAVLRELRLRLHRDWTFDHFQFELEGDLVRDEVLNEFNGRLSQAAVSLRPSGATNLRIGRQVLTWGTGDLLFLNDLFPKDFQSFFAGRDVEYLKAPSDAIRFNYYGQTLNVDLAWMPEFEPDRYLTGERFSFFSPLAGAIVAPDQGRVAAPGDVPGDGELALRLHRTRDGVEWAVYGYRGFFKSPAGQCAGMPCFPRLNTAGASLRRPLGQGLINIEAAYYDSVDDRNGDDPLKPNSQLRALVGYETEIARNLTLGLQGYLERTLDHGAAEDRAGVEKNRSVATIRLTRRALRDRLTWSAFLFASPSDHDHYLRLGADYRRDDHWQFSAGINAFSGDRPATFFSQLDGNDNAYARLRYSF